VGFVPFGRGSAVIASCCTIVCVVSAAGATEGEVLQRLISSPLTGATNEGQPYTPLRCVAPRSVLDIFKMIQGFCVNVG
jgi:hypothetical protein